MNLSGDSIKKGIIAAFMMLGGIVAIVGGIFLAQYVYAIVLGSVFQVTETGNLPITPETTDFLNTTQTSYFGVSDSVISGASFAGSLIPIAVILLVFAGLIVGAYYGYNKMKDKKGGNNVNY